MFTTALQNFLYAVSLVAACAILAEAIQHQEQDAESWC